MTSCVFRYCKNTSTNVSETSGVHFHRFVHSTHPKREEWIKILQNDRSENKWLPTKYTHICSAHFKADDFYMTKAGKRFLKKSAVPYSNPSEHADEYQHASPTCSLNIANLLLISNIRRRPYLYNPTLKDYSKREVTDRAWKEISKELRLPVTECKEKWKNLRYGFLRSLKFSHDGSLKKKYYLHDEMEFVKPFIKGSNKRHKSCASDDSEYIEEHSTTITPKEAVKKECDTRSTIYFDDSNNRLTVKEEMSSPQSMTSFDNTNSVLLRPETEMYAHYSEESENPRRMFLLSLLPDVNELSQEQMRLFKRKVLKLLDNILAEPKTNVRS